MPAHVATLIAALVAAIAGIVAAVVSSRTAQRVAKQAAEAQSAREMSAFRRERLARMKDMLFDAALILDTTEADCESVAWLAATSMAEVHDRCSAAMARVKYALEELKAMGAVEPSRVVDPQNLFGRFAVFSGCVSEYKSQIEAGNIALSGQAKDVAKAAEAGLLQAHQRWREDLNDLRTLTAQIRFVT